MLSRALIGLGSNLGDRRGTLEGAIRALGAAPGVVVERVSAYLETEPIGGPPGQAMYLNAAAALETTLDPFALLGLLHQTEARFGRVRTIRWGERTLDLDLLLFNDSIINTPELSVPHPRLTSRRFVLETLAEIAPLAVEPVSKRTIAELLADLGRKLNQDGQEKRSQRENG
jgi:2-amino-4-hydroxy-6-hydroxymethyldihydropteridine diphosphokinase